MTQAYRQLYDPSRSQPLPATHAYVKLMPTTEKHFQLLEALEITTFNFPLEYEVLEMGDHYDDPSIAQGENPPLYAVLDMEKARMLSLGGRKGMGLPYELISDLVLAPNSSYLVQQAFEQVGENYAEVIGKGPKPLPPTVPPLPNGCNPDSPDWPQCLGPTPIEDCNPDSWDYPECLEPTPPCNPDSPDWPDCQDVDPPPPPDPVLNDCGCEISSNIRFPGGCIQVADTETGFEGVRRVKVIMKDTWFTEDETWTDDRGCWKIEKPYSGKAWMWIKFKSDRVKIRGVARNWTAAWQWLTPVKHFVGKKSGPVFNNVKVEYFTQAFGSQDRRYWGAATVNNALHEFHDFASADGINPPPDKLDIFIGGKRDYGYTLMSEQDVISSGVAAGLSGITFWAGPFSGLIAFLGGVGVQAYLPEVFIGTKFDNSDRVKQLAYHEIAHASHFTQVGSQYWRELVQLEIVVGNNGHGTANSPGAGRISISESWAGHIGHTYADRTYGTTTSIGTVALPVTWVTILERTRNESPNHIPVGLYHDLVDSGQEPFSFNQDGSGFTIVADNVSGFTNAQMFSCLTMATQTVEDFEFCLISNHLASTTNSVAQVNALFNSY